MAVDFSETRRKRYAKILSIVHLICIVPSVACLIIGIYIQVVLQENIQFAESYDEASLPGFLIFTGFFGLTSHVVCAKIIWSNHKVHKRPRWGVYLLPVVILTCLLFIFELTAGILCFVNVSKLEESFDTGIRKAMKGYRKDVGLKLDIDQLQMNMECCGSRSYTDWFAVPWIHPDYVNSIKKNKATGNRPQEAYINDDVPFSCCKSAVLRPCIHHHVHDNDMHYNYDYKVAHTLHKHGCTTKLALYYEDSILKTGGSMILGLSFIQLILALSIRLLQTAVTDPVLQEDPKAHSTGYLFTLPGDDGDEERAPLIKTVEAEEEHDTDVFDSDHSEEISHQEDIRKRSLSKIASLHARRSGMDETVDPEALAEPVYENIYMEPAEPIYENIDTVPSRLTHADYPAVAEDGYDDFDDSPPYRQPSNARMSRHSLVKVRSQSGSFMSIGEPLEELAYSPSGPLSRVPSLPLPPPPSDHNFTDMTSNARRPNYRYSRHSGRKQRRLDHSDY